MRKSGAILKTIKATAAPNFPHALYFSIPNTYAKEEMIKEAALTPVKKKYIAILLPNAIS